MPRYVLEFREIDKHHLSEVGGKGADLGEMTAAGLPVPPGFCVTTDAYRDFVRMSGEMGRLLDQLDQIDHRELDRIAALGRQIRDSLHAMAIPEEIQAAIERAWEAAGTEHAYAVRSSATAEDLPGASFAGQQDTYLNVRGRQALMAAVRKCWASLFTDRAISYRAKNGFDHRAVFLSVVVQQMVFPDVSGILFTADPITGHRGTIAIDASFGLGEALVSGLVTADLYQVRGGKIVTKKISRKEKAIYAVPEGGTVTEEVAVDRQESQALPDERILELAALGRRIEAHYGSEQDIEWGLADRKFYILQSRPITSLYPLPATNDDRPRVYMNFGYIQMMTDAMKPLALSVLSSLPDFVRDDPDADRYRIMRPAGGRMFADLAGPLSVKPVRRRLLRVLRGMDEQLSSALAEVTERADYQRLSFPLRDKLHVAGKLAPIIVSVFARVAANRLFLDPSAARPRVEAIMDAVAADAERQVGAASGADRIRGIRRAIRRFAPDVLAHIVPYLITGVLAAGALEKKLRQTVGEERAASLMHRLNKSLPGNVTTEIGLVIGDLADRARDHPELVAYLQRAAGADFLEPLSSMPGGADFRSAFEEFLTRYGMRCAGEIDITKPRWYEDPSQLLPSLVSNLQTAAPGEHRTKYREGERDAEAAAEEVRSLFRGGEKRRVSRLVELYRGLMGLREHHKFAVIRLLACYKRAIMEEAGRLAARGVLERAEDIDYFSLDEIAAMLEDRFSGDARAEAKSRAGEFARYARMKSPRVMTGDGEIIAGRRRRAQAPEGALLGTPVSAGIVEGRARIIVRLEDAKLLPGEILVAPYTDPGWTPLFTSAVGLVTEVGGMMTHGSVVAREYGIPAVVGIEGATETIPDGARIRVDGTNGFVEVLEDPAVPAPGDAKSAHT